MVCAESVKIFWELLRSDLMVLRSNLYDDLINVAIWMGTMLLITRYLLPSFGLASTYSTFFAAGAIATCGNFEIYSGVASLLADLSGERRLAYYLSLPITSWLVFFKMALVSAIRVVFMGLIGLIVAKLTLINDFSFAQASLFQVVVAFVTTGFFFGFFTLFLASCIPGLHKFGNILMRLQFPLWFFGGFQFSWKTVHDFHPILGYASLFNPYMVSIEGMRAALLGQEGYLPFWLCMAILVGVTCLCAFFAIKRFKRRLDFI